MSRLTDIPGSSAYVLGGVVVYSNALKQSQLGVTTETLQSQGAVSEAAAREMATGALAKLGGDVAVAVTGIAGPTGAQPGKPVGTVWFAWAQRRGDAIFVGHEFERGDGAAGFKRGVNLPQQALTGRNVEVMQEICEQNHVVVIAEVRVEGAA